MCLAERRSGQVGSDGEWSLQGGELVVEPALQDHCLYVARLDLALASSSHTHLAGV